MKSALGENLTKYFEDIKKSYPHIKSTAQAIAFLIEKMNEVLENEIKLSERTVRKWLNGEAYPETDKLIVLSNILNVSLDKLLKDRTVEVHLKNTLPTWYGSLNQKSKSILNSALEIYLTGDMSRKRLMEIQQRELSKLMNENKKVTQDPKLLTPDIAQQIAKFFSGLIADFYFACDCQEDKIIIHSDKFFTVDELIKIEIGKHKKHHQFELAEAYLSEHKKSMPAALLTEELLKVIDISYREAMIYGEGAFYYGEENIIYESEEETVRLTLEDNETDSWNEIPYYIHEEPNFLNDYRSKIGKYLTKNQCDKIIQDCEQQIEKIKRQYFSELYECNIVDFRNIVHEFDIIFFSDKNSSASNYYLNVRAKFNLTEKEIRQILSHAFQEKITANINKMNKAIDIERQRAEAWQKLFEAHDDELEKIYKDILKGMKDENDD